ncbi:hypothetical protein IHQ71_10865 [Rhizobium sp. TH2]|uniref:hypothetical protein n=1 Tax=Rhizobium sp. TH2 TaxID=2775403 RepID=UPI002157D8AD|nr:hypothetical protein [Rhizobium sp. TH2]UVC11032.1 hypothetical protein IHQ71_10865 [Rhizobium sp. TH2]
MNIKPANDNHNRAIAGDPGVGGLLADPLESDRHRDKIDPGAGEASADPAPPRHHRDWSPNKQPKTSGPNRKDFRDA